MTRTSKHIAATAREESSRFKETLKKLSLQKELEEKDKVEAEEMTMPQQGERDEETAVQAVKAISKEKPKKRSEEFMKQ